MTRRSDTVASLLLVAGLLFATGISWAESQRDRSGGAGAKASVPFVLREGTMVGPLRGRFVVSGQRWRFLVEQNKSGVSSSSEVSHLLDDGVARVVVDDPDTLLGKSRSAQATQRETSSVETSPTQLSVGQLAGGAIDVILVTENLALDRIVRAIENDPDDDRWTVTGRITEFRDQNRLTLITAIRTSTR